MAHAENRPAVRRGSQCPVAAPPGGGADGTAAGRGCPERVRPLPGSSPGLYAGNLQERLPDGRSGNRDFRRLLGEAYLERADREELGRASCRDRVCQDVENEVCAVNSEKKPQQKT